MSSWQPDYPWSKLQKQNTQRTSQLKEHLGHWDKSCCLKADNVCLIVSKSRGSRSYLMIHDILTASRIVPISHKTAKWVVLKKRYHLCLKFSFIWKGYCWISKKSYFCNLSLKYQDQNWNIDTGASSKTIWNSDIMISIVNFSSHYRGQFDLYIKTQSFLVVPNLKIASFMFYRRKSVIKI